jgi:hypothetical protein
VASGAKANDCRFDLVSPALEADELLGDLFGTQSVLEIGLVGALGWDADKFHDLGQGEAELFAFQNGLKAAPVRAVIGAAAPASARLQETASLVVAQSPWGDGELAGHFANRRLFGRLVGQPGDACGQREFSVRGSVPPPAEKLASRKSDLQPQVVAGVPAILPAVTAAATVSLGRH